HLAIHSLVVGHPGANGIGEGHPTLAIDLEKPGYSEHRIGTEHRGVEKVVVDPPIDHVHLLAALGSPHPDAAVLHIEVPALAELDAHLLGEEGVLGVST